MATTVALTLSKWVLDLATKLIKANVRLHNVERITDEMAVIFVVNHFTRLETLLLPYTLHRHTGKEIWALAAAELFVGRLGSFLESTGTVSTRDPDRDTRIVRSLLNGEHPWLIFPEGAMIKDKHVVNDRGEFEVYSGNGRRPPHTGPAALALRAEFYRHKIGCLHDRPGQEGLARALEKFALDSAEQALAKRTVIVPVNVTYYPMRAHENLLVRIAERYKDNLSPRALEELSVEGTVLAGNTDIDVALGDPIDVREYLNAPEYASLMACSLNDMDDLQRDPKSLFQDAVQKVARRYMKTIYRLTTLNLDHVFAALLRRHPAGPFSEPCFRRRAYLGARRLRELPGYRRHESLEAFRDLLSEEPCPQYDDFLALCEREGSLRREGADLVKSAPRIHDAADFHLLRTRDMTYVIANEVEPLAEVTNALQRVARTPAWWTARRVRALLIYEDRRRFEGDYARWYDPALSKSPDVGRPFFLKPFWVRGGVLLIHGYMAAPLEVRALGDYLYTRGYAVYGVRLRGHGTSPMDLAQRSWQDWYASLANGYAVLRSLTDHVVCCGFSMGGLMALLAAARKGPRVCGIVPICAPLQVRSGTIRFVPSIVTMNALMKRIGTSRMTLEYVENDPENKHINYTKNPLTAIKQLAELMRVAQDQLQQVRAPMLVVQGAKDPTVNPISAQGIFNNAATRDKELVLVESERHGIVNGDGSEDVFEHVFQFLEHTRTRPAPAAAMSIPPPGNA
ncbi:MAG: alpha/beta fold hydrolase [Candidatus Hydrogenedentes bacterium]|nr:alpha/beta fold hydrolase [Candidatus Hydrogenedentota bacterium]